MYCPKCRSEYEPGIIQCRECETALVDALPPEDEETAEEFVPLREITDPDELPVIKSVLEASGVPFVLQGEETQGLFPLPGVGATLLPPTLGAIVLVPAGRLDEARELLETMAVPTDPDPGSPDD